MFINYRIRGQMFEELRKERRYWRRRGNGGEINTIFIPNTLIK